MKITNAETGRTFNLRIVNQGEKYGLNNCLTHDEPKPLIEFYDQTYANKNGFGELGQFVSRYYVETIQEHNVEVGIRLDGGVPEWEITAENVQEVLNFIG